MFIDQLSCEFNANVNRMITDNVLRRLHELKNHLSMTLRLYTKDRQRLRRP